MKRFADSSSQSVFYLTAGSLFGAAVLRSLLAYRDSPVLAQVLGLLLAWLVLFATEPAISRRWCAYFPLYLVLQTILILALLLMPVFPDYFAILFSVLGMQIMQRYNPGHGVAWIGLFAPLMLFPLVKNYGAPKAVAFTLVYTAVSVFLAAYARATRRAQATRAQNQALAQELHETNRQLQDRSRQLERLAVVRERNHLARELHDSVTQTIFSMTLTTQSALLLLDRDPGRVGAQLDRLNQLAQSALSEMRVLISELRPEKVVGGGLVAALRLHLADRRLPETLSVSLEVEGDGPLEPAEEQGLFRIAQEALNNVVKHARASRAQVRLHLAEPFWMEIADQGQGFDLRQARNGSRVGLVSMSERASQIGWDLHVITSPGAGTRIRVEKPPGGRQA
jgi:signal transduction histidine kinase